MTRTALRSSDRQRQTAARAWAVGLSALALTLAARGAAAQDARPASAPSGAGAARAATPAVRKDASTPRGRRAGNAAWRALFDGSDLAQWRGYKRQDVPAGWRIEDGTLAYVPGGPPEGRGDIVTREQYGDFELELEWKVAEGGNSGIFYRASEEQPFVFQTGAEMQVLDNTRHQDGKNPLTSAGANYALYPPTRDVTRPVGEWNAVRIVARGPRVEHWLNGERVVVYEQGSADWEAKVKASKFNAMPHYGRLRSGHIALQDHGDHVWFRNVRIRRLDAGTTGGAR